MFQVQQFFELIYKYTPDPDKYYVAWGNVQDPLYLTVSEVIADGQEYITHDRDVYFTPAVLKEVRRIKSNVSGSSVVWVDRDLYKNGEVTYDPLLPPTAIVTSGKGQHLYWALDNWYNPDDVERANQVLLKHLRLKPECWARNQVLRVPGSYNCKYKDPVKYPDYTEPIPCELMELNPALSYNINDILRLQTYDEHLLTEPTNGNGAVDRSRRDYRLTYELVKWGIADYAIENALTYHSVKAGDRPDYVDLTIKKVRDKFAVAQPAKDTNVDNSDAYFNCSVEPVGKLVNERGMEEAIAVELSWDGHSMVIPAKPMDFNSNRAVNQWLENNHAGIRIYTGSDKFAKLFYSSLTIRCPDVKQLKVQHAGRYDLKDNVVFIYGRGKNDVLSSGAEVGAHWKPLIDLSVRLKLDKEPPEEAAVKQMFDLIQAMQVPGVIQPCLGWIFMNPFNPLLEDIRLRLPILLLFGFAGSGKTSLIEYGLLPLLGLFGKAIAADSTNFSLMGSMTLSTSWPAWIGEYRGTNENANTLHRLLREAYDHAEEPRGTASQQIISHKLVSPVIVDGENQFTDGANAGRSVMLRLDRENIVAGSEANYAFQKLLNLDPKLFQQFAHTYISWTLNRGPEYIARKVKAAEFVFQDIVQAREARNFAVVWAGLSVANDFFKEVGWDIQLAQDEEAFFDALAYTYNTSIGNRTQADDLVEQITHFAHVPDLGTIWDQKAGVLWFSLPRAIRILRESTTPNMLKIQLRQRTENYIVALTEKGGSMMWGIDIAKAREAGLDVLAPSEKQEVVLQIEKDGNVK